VNKELRLIKTYRALSGDKLDGRFPFVELERLLANAELEPLFKNDFQTVKYDLEEQQKVLTNSMGRGSSSSANLIGVIKEIEQAKKNIDLLRTHGMSEQKLTEFVKAALRHRKQHRQYLTAVQSGIEKVKNKQEAHTAKLRQLVTSLKWAVECSSEGSLPRALTSKAVDLQVPLTMSNLEARLRRYKKKQAEDEPILYPSQTYSLAYLRGKRVIATIGDKGTKSEFSFIFFTFNMSETGDWKVKSMHKRKAEERVLFSFEISADSVADMKRAGKTGMVTYHNGFVTFNCFFLVQLLSRIASSMS
jgi:hypothetical protein